jgi:site-specific DNA-methyltransferase (adenine-specific)
MNSAYLDTITLGDCSVHLKNLEKNSIDLFLSDIPYGINQDEWDVFHENTNSAFLGQSPAQIGKKAFKRRGKPINGWNEADKEMNRDYQKWVYSWSAQLFPIMKEGASLFVFGARRTLPRAIVAFEDSGFLLRDVLAWKKQNAHHRAQRVSEIFKKRGLLKESGEWHGWRLGNLAPIYEPIAWFFKPYKSITITDNILKYGVGAMNIEACKVNGSSPTNLLEFWFEKGEKKIHEAQKPVKIMEFLINLTTRENHVILDPFMGSGTTAVAAMNLNRHFIGFEIVPKYHKDSLERLNERTHRPSQVNNIPEPIGLPLLEAA